MGSYYCRQILVRSYCGAPNYRPAPDEGGSMQAEEAREHIVLRWPGMLVTPVYVAGQDKVFCIFAPVAKAGSVIDDDNERHFRNILHYLSNEELELDWCELVYGEDTAPRIPSNTGSRKALGEMCRVCNLVRAYEDESLCQKCWDTIEPIMRGDEPRPTR